jgi:hypothetical protein
MNFVLRDSIVKHILSNFAILPSSFVKLEGTKSLKDKGFLLEETLPFTNEDGTISKNKVWGCQIAAEAQELKILLGDCSQEGGDPEYSLLVSGKDLPSYGVYFVDGKQGHESLIACTLDGKDWMECQTYLQATFLAGMEQIRDIGSNWSKCINCKDQHIALMNFIKFHNMVYEAKYI